MLRGVPVSRLITTAYQSALPYFSSCSRILIIPANHALDLVASFSQRGVRGEIRFSGDSEGGVVVTADLSVAQGAEGEYTWGVYEFPIDYTKVRQDKAISNYCD